MMFTPENVQADGGAPRVVLLAGALLVTTGVRVGIAALHMMYTIDIDHTGALLVMLLAGQSEG